MMLQDIDGRPVPHAHAADALDAFVSLYPHEHRIDRPAANPYEVVSKQLAIVGKHMQRSDEKVSAPLIRFAGGTPQRDSFDIFDDHCSLPREFALQLHNPLIY